MNMASLTEIKRNPKIPDIAPGDTVRVSIKVVEGGKERIQPFQGVVIKLQRGGINSSFTVRRVAYGVGVERTFPVYSPRVEKVEIIRHGKVRRAKLYYLRGRSGKAARIKERRVARGQKLAQIEAEAEPELEQAPEPLEAVQEETEAAQPQEELEVAQAEKEPEAAPTQEEPEAAQVQEQPEADQVEEEPKAALTQEEPEATQGPEQPEAEQPQEEPESKPE